MNIIEVLALMFFAIDLGIFLSKIYNIMSFVKVFDIKASFLTLIVSFFSFLITLATLSFSLDQTQNMIRMFAFIHHLNTFIFSLVAFFTIIEVLLYLSRYALQNNKRIKI